MTARWPATWHSSVSAWEEERRLHSHFQLQPLTLRTLISQIENVVCRTAAFPSHMMNELEQVQDTLAKLVALYPESLSHADLDDAD